MFVSLARQCIVYVVKKVASLSVGGLDQLMGMARKRTHVRATEDSETANNCCIYM